MATKSGRGMLLAERRGALLSQLLVASFWRGDPYDFGRVLLGGWPRHDIGVVLWSLCVVAVDWHTPETLVRLCTIPINGVLEADWDVGSTAMESHVLRPLLWLGLIEHRQEDVVGSRHGSRHLYRKTPLFDQVLVASRTSSAKGRADACRPRHREAFHRLVPAASCRERRSGGSPVPSYSESEMRARDGPDCASTVPA